MIILDTHAWIWWLNANGGGHDKGWRALVGNADCVAISGISLFETAWLQRHGRIALGMPLSEWFSKATAGSGIDVLPITPEIAETAVNLPEHHSDPQDRIIMATAIVHGAKLLSADRKFVEYDELEDCLVSI